MDAMGTTSCNVKVKIRPGETWHFIRCPAHQACAALDMVAH